jgi:hypothetical protein
VLRPLGCGWNQASVEEIDMSNAFNPGGEKGKLHRELGIDPAKKIPAGRLAAATRSRNPEIRRDAIRARTMKAWHHGSFAHHAPA